MKLLNTLFTILFIALITWSCKDEPKRVVKKAEVAFKKEAELRILRANSDSLLTELNIEIADSEYETQTGLMYRNSMEANQGMLFVFPDVAMHSFYMKNTEFPLDLIFIKEDLTIGSFQENAQPLNESSLSSKIPVQYVLEVNSGLIAQWGLKIGDRIDYAKL